MYETVFEKFIISKKKVSYDRCKLVFCLIQCYTVCVQSCAFNTFSKNRDGHQEVWNFLYHTVNFSWLMPLQSSSILLSGLLFWFRFALDQPNELQDTYEQWTSKLYGTSMYFAPAVKIKDATSLIPILQCVILLPFQIFGTSLLRKHFATDSKGNKKLLFLLAKIPQCEVFPAWVTVQSCQVNICTAMILSHRV